MTQITGNLDMYVYLICHALQINEKAKKRYADACRARDTIMHIFFYEMPLLLLIECGFFYGASIALFHERPVYFAIPTQPTRSYIYTPFHSVYILISTCPVCV